ncbi:MAG: tetratricopeptide repeat protein, partial [Pseudomonadota bacterium]|nr:tetratricopeptide repeat protein [Pseudomonadota bacterium]
QKDPGYLPAINALAKVAYENQDFTAAFSLLGFLVKNDPGNSIWLNNLGVVAAGRGDLVLARGLLQQAIMVSGSKNEVLYNLGCLAVNENDKDAALKIFSQFIAVEPGHIWALFALSRIAKELGRVDEAIIYCRKLVELAPNEAEFRQNLGFLLLKTGDWEEGFKLYEARWQANRLSTLPSAQLWDGDISQLKDKTILLWAEQGLGDTLQFARYLPQLQTIARQVIVAVPDLLLGLMQGSFPLLEVVSKDDVFENELKRPNYELQAPLLSLPYLFGSTLANLPGRVPYLQIEKDFLERWRKDLGSAEKLRVGLVWGGNPAHRNDARRSMALSQFASLFRVDGVSWYSLQKGEQEKELEDFLGASGSVCPENLAPKLESFEDTAAVIDLLDLVISVDTSVAHLAGALARPTWLLLPFDADWRWMLERDDSPWYPTMNLFRQPTPGDWQSVIAAVQDRLEGFVKGATV